MYYKKLFTNERDAEALEKIFDTIEDERISDVKYIIGGGCFDDLYCTEVVIDAVPISRRYEFSAITRIKFFVFSRRLAIIEYNGTVKEEVKLEDLVKIIERKAAA